MAAQCCLEQRRLERTEVMRQHSEQEFLGGTAALLECTLIIGESFLCSYADTARMVQHALSQVAFQVRLFQMKGERVAYRKAALSGTPDQKHSGLDPASHIRLVPTGDRSESIREMTLLQRGT